ncbi:MAG: gliding motility-associated C-terminal domain-containing protein [Bacteroidetes bacterium]|nr:gliding motility-associated C-terminal domain-containing protein [Bacteroidota bacterium]
MIKISTLLIAVLLFFHSAVYSQKEDYVWAFGIYGGLDFKTDPPAPFQTDIEAVESVASVSDGGGNLLFYTNGLNVWNKNNNLMPNGYGLLGNSLTSSAQGVLIVQDIAAPSKYYIFIASQREDFPDVYLRYSIVDMSLENGLGDLVQKNIILDSNVSEMLTAIGTGGCEKWIIDHKQAEPVFHAFQLTAAGLNTIPVVSSTGLDADYSIGMIKSDNNGEKIGCLNSNGDPQKPGTNTTQLFNFDLNTGHLLFDRLVIKGKVTDSVYDQFYSLAFSPSGNKLYTMSITNLGMQRFYQSDLTQPSSQPKLLPGGQYANGTDMRVGPDKKLYFGSSHYKLGLIQYPELDSPFCNLQTDAVDVSPASVGLGLPNDVIRTNVPFIHTVIACIDKDTLKAPIPGSAYLWSTGATSASILCDSAATYWLRTITACGIRIDTFKVSFNNIRFDLHDTTSCNNIPIVLNAPWGRNYIYTWQNGTADSIYTATVSGVYYLTVSNGYCSTTDTAHVTIYPPLNTSLLPNDTVLCEQAFPYTMLANPFFTGYEWSDTAAHGTMLTVDSPGVFWISKQTICGLYTDTTRITGCQPGDADIVMNTDTICENQCIGFRLDSFTNITSLEWSFPGGTPDTFYGPYPPDICYFSQGSYQIRLRASNAFGVVYRDTSLYVLPPPAPLFTDTSITAQYQSTVGLPACSPARRIEWYKDDSLICTGCDPLIVTAIDWQQHYTCVVHNATCRDECHYLVTATNIPAEAWLPSAFSPNNDGINDYFRLITDNPNISIDELSVYDRWGERLYHAQQNGPGWDGTFKSKPAGSGTYFWYLRYHVLGQTAIYSRKGELTLLR